MCERGGAVRARGQGVRRLRTAGPALLPDPPHGQNGQTGRNMETARIRRLRSQEQLFNIDNILSCNNIIA